jgi:pimeloyl-ACP methyl ester carboxylesterase
MLTEKTLTTSDGTIHYVEGPRNGRPLVLIHGNTGRWQQLFSLMPSLPPCATTSSHQTGAGTAI